MKIVFVRLCVYAHSSVGITDNQLINISFVVAQHLGSLEQCSRLATKLDIDKAQMDKLLHMPCPNYNTWDAVTMINSWRCQTESPSEAYDTLRTALLAIGRRDIVQECKRQLQEKHVL